MPGNAQTYVPPQPDTPLSLIRRLLDFNFKIKICYAGQYNLENM